MSILNARNFCLSYTSIRSKALLRLCHGILFSRNKCIGREVLVSYTLTDDFFLFGDDYILDDAQLSPPLVWISRYPSKDEASRAFNDAIESKREGLFSLYQLRHNEEKHPHLFQSCSDDWCKYARGAVGSSKRLFIYFEEKHERELHDADFNECDDPWCKRVWSLVQWEDNETTCKHLAQEHNARVAADPSYSETLWQFLESYGFSAQWLERHGYRERPNVSEA